MPRTEKQILNNWEFALGEPLEENYRKIFLPHDWAVSAPFNRNMDQGGAQGFRDRWGIGWYRRKLELQEKKSGYRYYLDFGGIFENSTVWVNGQEAGGRKYGYSQFRLDVTDFVRQGGNDILIRVDNTARPADRWYSGAGIYRTVKWIETEEKHLDEREIFVRTRVDGPDAAVLVDTGTEEPVRILLAIGDERIETVSHGGRAVIPVKNAKLWSAAEPNLYTLTLELTDGDRTADSVSRKVGIREVCMIPGKGMFVNGTREILKGVCVHQEAGCLGTAVRKEIWRERLAVLKEMGCNAIRAAHHIFPEEFLDLCDEMGFYVYEECFDKWTGGLYGRYFRTEWKADAECMVKRDRSRPSVILWGVGNEVEHQAQDSMLDILRMLTEHVRSLDDTRPVTYAMNPHFKRKSNVDASRVADIQKLVDEADDTEITDNSERIECIRKIADIVDIISCNYQEQWYSLIHERIPDKLILGTEVYQYFMGHEDQMQNFTEKNPSLVPQTMNYVIGSMIWTGYDYLGESMGYPAKGWSGALIRTNGVRKPGSYILESYWSKKPMVHFSVMDYSLADEGVKEHWDIPMYADHWQFPQFHKTVIPYMIASNCDEVALYVNRKRFYTAKPAECENRLIKGFLPYVSGEVKAVGYIEGREVCSHVTVTPGPAVKLSFEKPELRLRAQEGYELMLIVRAEDEAGNPYFRESAMVRFKTEGPAEVLAVDSGNLMSSEPYQEDFIHLYHGQAGVLIRLTGEAGRIAVNAYAEGMQSGRAVIAAD